MAKEEWGTKRACPKCTVRFYDLNRDPIICPSCGASFDLTTILETYKKPAKETVQKPEEMEEINPILDTDDLESDPIILDDDASIELGDELLEDDDDETVSLEDLTDVPSESDES
tara:strand:- start:75 stop:419 length:345 start_codon:yes stop_codon:yes gene_type:complete